MKKIAALFFVLFFIAGICAGEQFKIDYFKDSVKRFEAKDASSGKLKWRAEAITRKTDRNGQTVIVYSEKGAGIYGNSGEYKYWTSDSLYLLNNKTLIPVGGRLVFKDKNGARAQTLEKKYDQQSKKVTVTVSGKVSQFDFAGDLLDKDILPIGVMNYPFDEKRDFVFNFLTNDPSVYRMTLKYLGIENVTIGAKTYECHKLQMIPDLGLANIIGAFVPKTYFWCTVSFPHTIMKYEGLESGLNTPYLDILTIE